MMLYDLESKFPELNSDALMKKKKKKRNYILPEETQDLIQLIFNSGYHNLLLVN